MNIGGRHYTTIWLNKNDPGVVEIIDQRALPFRLEIESLRSLEDVCTAIRDMHLRGAPLIGVAGAFGMYLALLAAPAAAEDERLQTAAAALIATRPTAVNLAYAVNRMLRALGRPMARKDKIAAALAEAEKIRQDEIDFCRRIGEHGVTIIERLAEKNSGRPVNILTHCNAGWLACVDFGTATAPIYLAHDRGIKVHVWVDETRPRNQGARLTAYELGEHGVPHTVIVDNAGGHLMQHGRVDMAIVGSDRTTARGDVCNKIGTYLKALAAKDNGVPFYAALPSSTIDFSIRDGVREIEVEERNEDEVKYVEGFHGGQITSVLTTSPGSRAANPGFDVTPARLVSGIITERGIAAANEASLRELFPEQAQMSK
jgi:methylthioribose-1-phosphate isomerase